MGILDGIVSWLATQIMYLLDMVSTSVLGALGCDMSIFKRYFPAAETMYNIFVALAIGIILLNWVWQLFKNFGLQSGIEAEDPVKLSLRSALFLLLAFFAGDIVDMILKIGGTPYNWIMDSDLPPLNFASFSSVITVIVAACANGAVALIVLLLVALIAWNYLKLLFEAAERYILLGVLVFTAPVAFSMGASQSTSNIFKSWCRIFGGQVFLLIMNAWCLKLFTGMVGSFISNPLSVETAGREEVSGNLFIWFLCAIAFLKISQKIDSFMAALGINVGRTGGSMLAEAMIAARGFTGGKNLLGGGLGGNSLSRAAHALGSGGTLMSGGLSGIIGRQISNEKGGEFANNIIGDVAKGSISQNGTISGESAVKALSSYMGHIAGTGNIQSGGIQSEFPQYSNVEIGGGRITGMETTTENPGGIEFGMYHSDKYHAPDGTHSTVESVDGSKWYKQYAADTVDKRPYMTGDGSIAYNESLIKKLPKAPQRRELS